MGLPPLRGLGANGECAACGRFGEAKERTVDERFDKREARQCVARHSNRPDRHPNILPLVP